MKTYTLSLPMMIAKTVFESEMHIGEEDTQSNEVY